MTTARGRDLGTGAGVGDPPHQDGNVPLGANLPSFFS